MTHHFNLHNFATSCHHIPNSNYIGCNTSIMFPMYISHINIFFFKLVYQLKKRMSRAVLMISFLPSSLFFYPILACFTPICADLGSWSHHSSLVQITITDIYYEHLMEPLLRWALSFSLWWSKQVTNLHMQITLAVVLCAKLWIDLIFMWGQYILYTIILYMSL